MLRENQRQFLQFLDDPETKRWKWINLYGTVEGKSWIGHYIKKYKSDQYKVFEYEWENQEVFPHSDKQMILISVEPIHSETYHSQILFYHFSHN